MRETKPSVECEVYTHSLVICLEFKSSTIAHGTEWRGATIEATLISKSHQTSGAVTTPPGHFEKKQLQVVHQGLRQYCSIGTVEFFLVTAIFGTIG